MDISAEEEFTAIEYYGGRRVPAYGLRLYSTTDLSVSVSVSLARTHTHILYLSIHLTLSDTHIYTQTLSSIFLALSLSLPVSAPVVCRCPSIIMALALFSKVFDL